PSQPARHAGYAPGAHRSIGGCRRSGEAASLRRAGQASHRGVGGAGVPRLSRRLSPAATCGTRGSPSVPLSRPVPTRDVSRVGLLEGRAALGGDLDASTVDDDRHEPPSSGQLQQLRHQLRPRRHVDLAKRDAARRELDALAIAPRAAGPGVQQHREHQTSVEATSVAAALNIPPRPWQSATRQSGTCRAPPSPRSCRTASISVKMPYIPVCGYERPPPLVFIGNAPPGAVRWPATNGPPSPGLQKPSASSAMIGTMVKASYSIATSTSAGATPAIAKAGAPARRGASHRGERGIG